MYSIYVDSQMIYDDSIPDQSIQLYQGKLSLKSSAAGQLDFTLTPNHQAYDSIVPFKSTVSVRRSGSEIWFGRVMSITQEFNNTKKFTCEGALAFLNDIVIPSIDSGEEGKGYTGPLSAFIDAVFDEYEDQSDSERSIRKGNIDFGDRGDIEDFSYKVDFQNVYDILSDVLLNSYEGYPRVRRGQNRTLYFDFINKEDCPLSNQTIDFGENLLDFTKEYDTTEMCTRLIPLGGEVDGKKVTLEDATGSMYYTDGLPSVSVYGNVDKVVTWSDITDPAQLMDATNDYINAHTFDYNIGDQHEIQISAVDMHYLNADINSFNVLEIVRCTSVPHNMDHILIVSQIDIDFVNPANTKITLGTYKPKTLSERAGSGMDSVDDKEIEDISEKKAEEVLSENAAYVDTMVDSLVTNVLTRGYYHSDSNTFVLKPNIEKDVKGIYHWKKPPGSSTREKTFATTNTQRFREYIDISGKNIQFMYEPLVEPSNYSYITEAETELLTINGEQAYFKSIKNFDLGLTTVSPKTIDKTMSSDIEDMHKCRRLKTLRQNGQPMDAIPRLRIYSNSTFNETDNGGQTNVGIVFNEGEVEIEYKTTPNGQTSESDGVRQLSLNMNMMTEQGIELKNGVLLACDPSHEENGVGLYQGVNGTYFAVRPVKVFENITDLNADTEVPVGGIGYVKVGGVIS